MKKVYAVTSGWYSDYRVVAIFSTKTKAKDFIKAIPDSDYNKIEEYNVDPPASDLVKRGYSIYVVYILIDGTVERVIENETSVYKFLQIGDNIWKRTKAPAYRNDPNIQDVLISTVWAKTKEQAIKITNEHRIAMIANGKWS